MSYTHYYHRLVVLLSDMAYDPTGHCHREPPTLSIVILSSVDCYIKVYTDELRTISCTFCCVSKCVVSLID